MKRGPDLARKLLSLGDDRPWLTVLRTVQRLKHAPPDAPARPIAWSVAMMVRLLERERELEAEIAALRHDNATMYETLVEHLNEGRSAAW